MDAGAKALLDGPDGSFNFADVTVGRDNVHSNRTDVFADAGEFVVGM